MVQRLTELHEPVGRVQFVLFEIFTSAYLFYIARVSNNLLRIYKQQFRSRFSSFRSLRSFSFDPATGNFIFLHCCLR